MLTCAIYDFDQLKRHFVEAYEIGRNEVSAERTIVLTLDHVARTDGQNRHLHHLCTDISKQIIWHGCKLTVEEVKDMLTASLKFSKVIPGIDRRTLVVTGSRTSQMDYRTCADLILLATAFGNEQKARWSMTRDEMSHWGIAA